MAAAKSIRRVSLKDPQLAVEIIKEDGGVILTDFTTPELVEKVNRETTPFLVSNVDTRNEYAPPQTKRCSRLWGRSETVRENGAQQPEFIEIMNYFIETRIPKSHGLKGDLSTNPILSYSGTFNIGPGAAAQVLHRDDIVWQQVHENQETTGYQGGSDIGISLTVPGINTTIENGATIFYLGSHLWENSRDPDPSTAVYAEMEVGEALLFLGSCLHGGGANQSQDMRPVHGLFFCRSYIRPEENLHVWFTEEEVRKWSPQAQRQAGYLMDSPFLGYVDHCNAIDKFRANKDPAVVSTMVYQ